MYQKIDIVSHLPSRGCLTGYKVSYFKENMEDLESSLKNDKKNVPTLVTPHVFSGQKGLFEQER